ASPRRERAREPMRCLRATRGSFLRGESFACVNGLVGNNVRSRVTDMARSVKDRARTAFPADSSVVADVRPSPNHSERVGNQRPNMIVLHYTGMPTANAALDLLCSGGSQVSAHYFV